MLATPSATKADVLAKVRVAAAVQSGGMARDRLRWAMLIFESAAADHTRLTRALARRAKKAAQPEKPGRLKVAV